MLLKKHIEVAGIPFGLIAGTLLGAVRESDFISHDEDVDLYILDEYKQCVFDFLPYLFKMGFEIARYDCRGILSVIRKGEYIDLYFFSKYNESLRGCCGWLIPERMLLETSLLEFHGEMFSVPKDAIEYLRFEYGEDWKTPVKYFNYDMSRWKTIQFNWKEKIKALLPQWLFLQLAKSSEKKKIKKSMSKLSAYRNKL